MKDFALQDLLRPDILADPYPIFSRLRIEDPVHWDAGEQGWIISRYDDVVSVLADRRFSAERVLSSQGYNNDANPVRAALSRQMLFLDPPDHTRLRCLFTRAFTPQRIEGLRPRILEMVTRLIDSACEKRQFDFIVDFAIPLPVTVIAEMLGVPTSDRERLRAWSVAFGRLISGRVLTPQESFEAEQSILAFMDYFRDLIAERRRIPADDMISDLAAFEEQGDRLSTEELLVNLILLLAAGHGTTTHLLGNGLLALFRHRDQWRLLGANPSVAALAVGELLRYDGPVQLTSREALQDLQLGGRTIAQGQRITVILGSANRDPEHFPDPDTLDLRRSSARPVSFGHGIHTCLGAALARMEAQVAFSELARRFPSLRLGVEKLEWAPSIAFRGLQSLPVTCV
jgi:hypothetical protein